MTVQVGCGPTWTIDGPPPSAPMHTLVGASRVVEDVTEGEIERWLNGVKLYPFPEGPAHVWDAQATGTTRGQKTMGAAVPLPQFQAMAVYLGETCTAAGISGGGLTQDEAQARFVERANVALGSVEAAAVEAEFMGGAILGGVNPFLADGNGDTLHGGTAVNLKLAFALLENAIGATGRAGIIHCTPAAALIASGNHILWRDDRGPGGGPVIRTVNGTIVIPGYGYVGAPTPIGESAPGANQEWIYASGPVEMRRSATFLIPERFSEALDRTNNDISYLVERYYVADWDTTLQAAVLADWGI